MFFRKWLINIVLLGIAVFLGAKAYEDWHRIEEAPPEAPAVQPRRTAPPEPPVKVRKNSKQHYDVVAEKSLFSSTREEPPPPAPTLAAAKKAKPKLKKAKRKTRRVVLYGVVSLNGVRKALVQDPSQRSRNKKNTWVTEGGTVAGMTVERIETKRILLTDGVESHEILLYDREKPKPRTAPRRSPGPTIIATGTGKGAPASRVGRPKKLQPKKKPAQPKKKPRKTPQPPRVQPKTKKAPKKKTTKRDSSRDGRVANPFENLLRRD